MQPYIIYCNTTIYKTEDNEFYIECLFDGTDFITKTFTSLTDAMDACELAEVLYHYRVTNSI